MTDCSKIPTLELIEESKSAMSNITTFVKSSDPTFTDYIGNERDTMAGAVSRLFIDASPQYLPPVTALDGQTQFFVGTGLNYINVNRSGTIEFNDKYTYDQLTGYITLNEPAESGELFQFGFNFLPSSTMSQVNIVEPSIQMLRPKTPAFVAHRGASRSAPENTLASFELAGKNGFWGCECDARLTSDDAWVIIHDETVDRTTNGTGSVSSKNLAQIKALDAGSWFDSYFSDAKIPLLSEYLQSCQKYSMFPQIEIKTQNPTTEQLENFVGLCIQAIPDRQFAIQSINITTLSKLRAIDKDIFLKYTVGNYSDSYVDTCASIGKCMLTIVYTAIPTDPAYARSKNVEIAAWTVNDYDAVAESRDKGAVEIFSDYISE